MTTSSTDVTYQVEPMSRAEVDETLRECVCSNCWGTLVWDNQIEDGQQVTRVLCQTCRENTKGYVSRKFAERKRAESEVDLMVVKRNLGRFMGPPKAKRTPEEILKSLGF